MVARKTIEVEFLKRVMSMANKKIDSVRAFAIAVFRLIHVNCAINVSRVQLSVYILCSAD